MTMWRRRRRGLACDVCCFCHTHGREGKLGRVSMEQEDILPILSIVQNLHAHTSLSGPGLISLGVMKFPYCTCASIGLHHAGLRDIVVMHRQIVQCM